MAFRKASVIAPAALTASLTAIGVAAYANDGKLNSAVQRRLQNTKAAVSMQKNGKLRLLTPSIASCEGEQEKPSLIEQADQMIEESRKIKSPPQFDDFKRDISRLTEIQSFDGFRMIVLRSLNMNAAVQHMFWMGTTALEGGQSSMYNYTMILGGDNSSLQLTADPSFNISAEARTQLDANYTARASWALGKDDAQGSLFLDYSGESSTTSVKIGQQGGFVMQLGFMQALTPQLFVGAQGLMNPSKQILQQSFGGRYDSSDYTLSGLMSGTALQLNYIRKVNPNRVNLVSDLSLDLSTMTSEATIGAEFQLAQSRLHMTVDSKALIRSVVETRIHPRMQMQFSAEMMHMKEHYKFGYGLIIGG